MKNYNKLNKKQLIIELQKKDDLLKIFITNPLFSLSMLYGFKVLLEMESDKLKRS